MSHEQNGLFRGIEWSRVLQRILAGTFGNKRTCKLTDGKVCTKLWSPPYIKSTLKKRAGKWPVNHPHSWKNTPKKQSCTTGFTVEKG